jgi:hypothetical protein
VGVGTERGDLAGDVDVVLDGDGDTEQGALSPSSSSCVGLVGLEQRSFGEHHPECVQLSVEAVDPLQVELDELTRGDLAGGDQLGLAGDARKR